MHGRVSVFASFATIIVSLAVVSALIRASDLYDENVRLTRALHQARTEPTCRDGEYLSLLDAGGWSCRPGSGALDGGDVTSVHASPGLSVTQPPPDPSQAELAASPRPRITFLWDPLRRCVPGISAEREWLTTLADMLFEFPAGIGCGGLEGDLAARQNRLIQ